MFKTLVCLALLAVTSAGLINSPSAVLYQSPPEYPFASGYEYQHTIQTPDYATHSSVSAPLNGFASPPSYLRSIYGGPYGSYYSSPLAAAAYTQFV